MVRKRRVFFAEGQRFGRGQIIDPEIEMPPDPGKNYPRRGVRLQCDCGTIYECTLSNLPRTQSCGCALRGYFQRGGGIAGGNITGHPLYPAWVAMIQRCENAKIRAYRYCGARGIAVCESWHDFAAFVADIEREIGPRPPGTYPSGRTLWTLSRKDNDGDYEPGNVRWAGQAGRREAA